MNEQSLNFIFNSLINSELLLEDLQNYFISNKVSNDKTLTWLNIVCNYLVQGNDLQKFLLLIKDKFSEETVFRLMEKVLKDNEEKIKKINFEIEKEKFNQVKLTDIEWKLVGSASLENAETDNFQPRIILKLKFSNDLSQIIETDFAGLKKLQEEFELSSSGFNSAYSKRLIAFSK